ncbi:MAG: hypothetical protein E7330_07250 [Clostridiales bacterium]|nr:hypothetical protein [Clostridiales bacterium]
MAKGNCQSIIPFYGVRRGAARVESGKEGISVSLSLRPEPRRDAPEPTAALIASAKGETVRIPLEKGQGRAEHSLETALLLLCAAGENGEERIVAEGVRGGFDRRTVERLKEPLRSLRRAAPKAKAAATETGKEKEALPEETLSAAVPAEKGAAEGKEPGTEVPGTEVPGTEVPGTEVPQSEALREILKRAEELFPEGTETAGHFPSDAPFETPFVPRPLAARQQRQPRRAVPAGRVQDDAWQAAVREMRSGTGEKLSGVGRAEGQAEPLFPLDFPDAAFRRVRWPGSRRYYLEGHGTWEGKRAVFYALPGEACPAAPFESRGFQRFVRDKNGSGYWVKIKRQG